MRASDAASHPIGPSRQEVPLERVPPLAGLATLGVHALSPSRVLIVAGTVWLDLLGLLDRRAVLQRTEPERAVGEMEGLLYFSIGTLTGVAYGDILPVHPMARLLSSIEAVIGQMYMAVLVAMLMSDYAAGRSAGSAGGRPTP
jgi:ion channel